MECVGLEARGKYSKRWTSDVNGSNLDDKLAAYTAPHGIDGRIGGNHYDLTIEHSDAEHTLDGSDASEVGWAGEATKN